MLSDVFIANAVVILAMMLALWGLSIPLRNVSIVDIAWGIGFIVVSWTSLAVGFVLVTWAPMSEQFAQRWMDAPSRWLLPVLTTVWGLRLSGYLAWRNHGLPEDKRYAAMRSARPGTFWWQSLYIVFLLQGVVMWMVSLPLQLGIVVAEPGWMLGHALGIALWLTGLFFETVGDWQLASFKANPANRGKVLDTGLWRYTRHPNYFGDFCVWWGLYLIAVAHGVGLWTILGPLVMSILLMRFSGVTLLEKSLNTEKPEYAEYIRRTNAFFPGPVKN